MRIEVDTDNCIGAGQCVLSAPGIFDQTDEGLVDVLVPEPDGKAVDDVHEAIHSCPSGSIRLIEQ